MIILELWLKTKAFCSKVAFNSTTVAISELIRHRKLYNFGGGLFLMHNINKILFQKEHLQRSL